MMRGNERKNIFNDDDDKARFIETLFNKKQEGGFLLPAFCLMDNHVHLIIKERMEDLAQSVKRIAVSYVYYFNKKYRRVGHLFQDRFKSEVIESERYLLSLARYIHQNPVKAGIVHDMSKYRWSSYSCYTNEEDHLSKLVDQEIILGLFHTERSQAQKQYIEFMHTTSTDCFIDIAEKNAMEEEEARVVFQNMLDNCSFWDGKHIPQSILSQLIIDFKKKSGLSVRRIAEITGIDKSKIMRLLKGSK